MPKKNPLPCITGFLDDGLPTDHPNYDPVMDEKPKPKRPRDTNQLAKYIVDLTTGDASEPEPSIKQKAGRLGGLKGGKARKDALTPERRSEIAREAAKKRWKKL